MDEYGLRSMENIDPVDLSLSSNIWENQGLVPMGKAIEHASLYGTEISDDENAESMMKMFVGLLAQVITHGVSKIHEQFFKFFYAEPFEGILEEKDSPLAAQHGIQIHFSAMFHHYSESMCASYGRAFKIGNRNC
jgi:hypothetical protein